MSDIVTIVCYGQEEKMTRKKALEKYFNGMMCCEGSERDRYTDIYIQLKQGNMVVSD